MRIKCDASSLRNSLLLFLRAHILPDTLLPVRTAPYAACAILCASRAARREHARRWRCVHGTRPTQTPLCSAARRGGQSRLIRSRDAFLEGDIAALLGASVSIALPNTRTYLYSGLHCMDLLTLMNGDSLPPDSLDIRVLNRSLSKPHNDDSGLYRNHTMQCTLPLLFAFHR